MSGEASSLRSIVALLKRFDFVLFYALSVAAGRGLSLVVLPLTSRFLPPGEYARLDVAASLIEICGLLSSFALADLLFRFASAGEEPERRRSAAEILGVGVVVAASTILLAQLLIPFIAKSLVLGVAEGSLRLGLCAASLGGLLELPLAWMRLKDRPASYLGFVALRAGLQAALMLVVLAAGFGPEGVIVSNACIEFVVVSVMVAVQIRETGIALPRSTLKSAFVYASPIVIGSLAMFGLGSCDRLFLAGAVEPARLACYTLAGKLALIAPLLLQPFALWWNPRRIAALSEEGGLERSRRMVSSGFVVLLLSALLTLLFGLAFIELALPGAYREATLYLPVLVLIAGLNETATLINVGSFARSHGRDLLIVNGAGGLVALAGYAALVPLLGIEGAIAATVAGHLLRIALFLRLGRSAAPIIYPIGRVALLALFVAGLVAIRPGSEHPILALLHVPFSIAMLGAVAVALRLVPEVGQSRLLAAWIPSGIRAALR